ncbi:tRNA pseudouridine(38-40) synthase TruA [Marinomonas sp. 15G1-11]|uniref:tRNA pseudouridine synthase A n=1 Tax=Marinomonas phaeophyticola TaxID=3004091 RepID=A0ABT4JPP6_9GAMM|nr:tRNA pseudouridine(38-40) synthase TruA [Marinomonas sp. 15G1-11]MCZ2720357.1 tRNA pseudouridine(38-40) synthase TruA [Marinomonas sp. 15G1-11]
MNRKIALVVEYKGTNYKGWQSQKGRVITVQDCLEKALSKIANHPVSVICAGRTDSGVHACYQVVHFETKSIRENKAWIHGVNSNLPEDISVASAVEVDEDFHARFGALSRRYRYIIYSNQFRSAVMAKEVTWTYRELDSSLMSQAAKCFLGTHDFTSYRAVGCQAHSPIRTIMNFDVYEANSYIVLDVRANAFLHHMIRNFAGVLMAIGAGDKPVKWAEEVLQARDRTVAGVTAPPYGLYFVDAEYPEKYGLPSLPLGPHFLPTHKENNYATTN